MPEKSTSVLALLSSLFASEKFIAAFIGLIAGTVATFVAPWTKWKFEKEKLRFENRKITIKKWREEIDKSEDYVSFQDTETFHNLKNKIPNNELEGFSSMWKISVVDRINPNPEKAKLGRFHEEVSKIEKEWGIV